jgi:ABC-2 type transport system ATP-binding protein
MRTLYAGSWLGGHRMLDERAPASGLAVEARGLTKFYGEQCAVRDVDLAVETGQVVALLGPNGAGKTTTIEMLEGYRTRTAGEVSVLGVDPQEAGPGWRERVGIVLQECQPEPELVVRECLCLYAGYHARPRPVDELLELVGLTTHASAPVVTLSGGERRRLDVALALVGDPDLLFLDEPTTGFDPTARRQAWEMVRSLQALNKTILLTTHYMDEAEALADHIVVLAGGMIVAEGQPETLGGRHRAACRISFRLPPGQDKGPPLPADAVVQQSGRHVSVETRTPVVVLQALMTWAAARDLELPDLEVRRPSLEDVYLELTEASR